MLAAQKIDLPGLALQSILNMPLAEMGDFGQALISEPTLLASINQFCKLVSTETSNVIVDLYPQPNGDYWFSHQLMSQKKPDAWHSNLYITGFMLKIVRLADPVWSPKEILMHSKSTRKRCEVIERLGSTPCLGQSSNGFMLPASMLALPVASNSAQRASKDFSASKNLFSDSYTESIKQLIQFYASHYWLSIDDVSEVIDQSVRSIQRRLSMEQTTYSNLVQQCRMEMASSLLDDNDATMTEIARQLGYNNQGNFTRAFYRWAKVSPSEFRKNRSLTY
jgi:AraC-like DNA-binding protein